MNNPLNANPNMNKDVTGIQGIFRGIVEDNEDPLNLCRLRVRIPSLNGDPTSDNGIPTEGLPWAAACVPYAGPGYGEVLIPEIGSTVWVIFENNSKDRPVWVGGCYGAVSRLSYRDLKSVGYNTFKNSEGTWTYGMNREDTPYEFIDRNKDAKVLIRTPKGFTIIIDEKDDREALEIVDRAGQIIRMSCPVFEEDNSLNKANRTYGSVADGQINDGVRSGIDYDNSYILIESQGRDNYSMLKLSDKRAFLSNGYSSAELLDDQVTVDNGTVRCIMEENEAYVTNNDAQLYMDKDQILATYKRYETKNDPDIISQLMLSEKKTYLAHNKDRFQIDDDKTFVTHGRSQVILRDGSVEMDNGSVGIRLGGSIELNGHVILPSSSLGMGSIEGDIDAGEPTPTVPNQ